MSERESPLSPDIPAPHDKPNQLTPLDLAIALRKSAKNKDWMSFGITAIYSGMKIVEFRNELLAREEPPSPCLPSHETVYEANFKVDGIEPTPEVSQPAVYFTPAQQQRVTMYEHVLRKSEAFQIRLFKGEDWQFHLKADDDTYLTNEEGYPLGVPITQEVVDSWYRLAKTIQKGLSASPATAQEVIRIEEKLAAERQQKIAAQKEKATQERSEMTTLWERSSEMI